ncbi:MAG: MlaD family protein [Tannerella sp.]|jgi:phospholipid/cholesterol/gamma-HCH transport system substrate-binding protein|nr:MlaD family protein [Tannerella sp.]
MKRKFTKEMIIGTVVIIALIMLYAGINYLKGINLFQPANHYYVSCTNVKDITISTPVYVDGFRVGLVRNITYDYTASRRISVEISLEEEMRITRGSHVSIERTLLSGAELHLRINTDTDEYLKPGAVLEGRTPEDVMATVQEKMLPQIAELIPALDSILRGLQTLINHPALSQSLTHIEGTTAQLEISSRHLNRLLANDVPVIAENLKTTSSNFVQLSEDLKKLDLTGSVHSLNMTLDNLNTTTARLNSRDNSLGLLLNDSSLYRSLNLTLDNLSGLLIDMKQHPKRYVHFSLF